MGYQGVVIWDWHDVPDKPKFHWDATLCWQGKVLRFEIDAESHEKRPRDENDVKKDQIVGHLGHLCLLRLQRGDNATWNESINAFRDIQVPGVYYTRWYQFLVHEGMIEQDNIL